MIARYPYVARTRVSTTHSTGQGAATTLSVPYVICQGGAGGWSTTSASEHNLQNCTIPANTLGAGGALRIRTLWSMTGSTNAKTLTVRYGAGSCVAGSACSNGTTWLTTSITSSGVTSLRCETMVWNRAATNSQVGGAGTAGCGDSSNGSGGGASITAAIDTTAASYVNIDGTTNGTETITLEAYTVEILPAGGN